MEPLGELALAVLAQDRRGARSSATLRRPLSAFSSEGSRCPISVCTMLAAGIEVDVAPPQPEQLTAAHPRQCRDVGGRVQPIPTTRE